MYWPRLHAIASLVKRQHRVLVNVLAVLLAVTPLLTAAQTARADTATVVGCFQTPTGQQCFTYPPPPLLNLNQSLYAATPAQAASLQALEDLAVSNLISAHGLSSGDGNAVLTWARNDAEAELFTLLKLAITTPACSAGQTPGQGCRTADQQNAVDWLNAVEHREAVVAAQDAGLEYVKWAGLDPVAYQSLLQTNPGQSALQAFFSTPGYPVPYNNAQTEGYCVYQAPAPDAADYTSPKSTGDPTCFGQSGGLFYFPPTPGYNNFTKWGEADANYSLLNTGGYLSAAAGLGIGAAFGYPVGALIGGAVAGSQVAAVIARSNLLNNLENVLKVAPDAPAPSPPPPPPSGSSPSAEVARILAKQQAELADAGDAADAADALDAVDAVDALDAVDLFTSVSSFAIVTVVLTAVEIAIETGINVGTAAQLPGKLATLIANAATEAPDVATLEGSSSGQTTLFELFVGATLPTPQNRTCDNSNPAAQAGVTILAGTLQIGPTVPCLNPTPIPAASPTDPQFLVQKKGDTASTQAATIAWKDAAANTTTTARLSGNWFVENEATQSLSILYTDWSGNEQVAWLVGGPGANSAYLFLTFSPPASSGTSIDPTSCVANGICGYATSIDYVGSDGQDYSVSVPAPPPPPPPAQSTGAPSWSASAAEGSPVTFNANTFAPDPASGAVTYSWEFEKAQQASPNVTTSCLIVGGGTAPCPPDYDTPVAGAMATYTWQASGTYHVSLTATDAGGTSVNDTFTVAVGAVSPTVSLLSACSSNPFGPAVLCNPGTWNQGATVQLGGGVGHAGSLDLEQVTVNWGDGNAETLYGFGNGSTYFIIPNASGFGAPPGYPLTLTPVPPSVASTLGWLLGDAHTYANPGVYVVTVTASQLDGPSDSKQFTETIVGTQAITFPAIPPHTYGDAPFRPQPTGGGSGQPVILAVSGDPSVCYLSHNPGLPDGPGATYAAPFAWVNLLRAGTCTLTASQAGSASYQPAPNVTQSFTVQPATLTVTASSPSITYGGTVPAIIPSYAGFFNGDTPSVLTTPPTCVVAHNNGAAGTYPTTCSGAAAVNYTFTYVPGTLTINTAPLTAAANNKTMTYGASVPAFDAAFNGFLNGDTSSVVSNLTCGSVDASNNPVSATTPAGQYPITCSGGTAANYALSYQPGTLTIDRAASSVTLADAPAAPVYGQPVTLTATLADASQGSSGNPSGTVDFKDGAADIVGCTAQPVSTTTETATCTTSALGVGNHSLTAAYAGDHNFAGSTTVSATALTVAKGATTVTLVPTTPVTQGQAVTFTAIVAAAPPGAGTPAGTVTFLDGATSLGTGQLSVVSGQVQATFSTSSLAAGTHAITATYAGDGNFLTSASSALNQYVNTNLSSYPKLPSGAYNLANANLAGGYFVGASLAGASLAGSNLTGAVFTGANLTGADLSNSNAMSGANFTNANLTNANLSNSNLKGASFAGANLSGANLTSSNLMGATELKSATLNGVIWNKTECPDGTLSSQDGGSCVGHL